MRIEMTFDRQKVERQGWTMEAVQETVRKNFEARGRHYKELVRDLK